MVFEYGTYGYKAKRNMETAQDALHISAADSVVFAGAAVECMLKEVIGRVESDAAQREALLNSTDLNVLFGAVPVKRKEMWESRIKDLEVLVKSAKTDKSSVSSEEVERQIPVAVGILIMLTNFIDTLSL